MEHRIIFATSNQGKMREIREILKGLGTEILSMKEAGVQADIVEDGDTFEANAVIKAKAVWEEAGGIVLADDSGLEVDALGGEPGVYSARYMGEKTSYEIKNWNLIHRPVSYTHLDVYKRQGRGFYPGGCAGAGGIQGGASGGSCEPAGAADFKNNRTIWFF